MNQPDHTSPNQCARQRADPPPQAAPARYSLPATRYFIHDTLDSTNDEAARLLADPAVAAPLVVIARQQTKGRGRLGRPWLSEPNGNLYISFGFRPRVAPPRLQTLTLWAGVTLCDFLAARIMGGREGKGSAAPAIKWPNDIFFGERKVAGLLTEARAASGNIDTLVLGLGLNLRPPAAGWPPELAATATSLAEQPGGEIFAYPFSDEEKPVLAPTAPDKSAQGRVRETLGNDAGKPCALKGRDNLPEVCGAPSGRGSPHDEYPGPRGLDPGLTCGTPLACKPRPSPLNRYIFADTTATDTNTFTAALIARVLDAYDQLLAAPAATAAALAALWQKYDHLRGKTITALSGNDRITGTASGIDAEGSLILKMPGASERKIRAGEVTIEKVSKHP